MTRIRVPTRIYCILFPVVSYSMVFWIIDMRLLLSLAHLNFDFAHNCHEPPYNQSKPEFLDLAHAGMVATGMKTPLTKRIGNRKKFINVIASNTSRTITEAINPSREKVPPHKQAPAKSKRIGHRHARRQHRQQ